MTRVMGLDWSRVGENTALVIIESPSGQVVYNRLFKSGGWVIGRGQVVQAFNEWEPVVIWAEVGGIGSANIEAFQSEGLPIRSYTMTGKSKPALLDSMVNALASGRLTIPDQIREIFPPREQPYHEGWNDPMLIATALAWYGVKSLGLRVDFA